MRRATLEGHTSGGVRAVFHPAGTVLASNGWEERLRLWDPILGRTWLSEPGAATTDGHFFSRDGRIVLLLGDRLTPYQVEPAREYRSLVAVSTEIKNYDDLSIRPDGRTLAAGTPRGVILWDLASGAELEFLPIGPTPRLVFASSGDLITSGAVGVRRWPIRLDAGRSEFRLGPPRGVPLPTSPEGLAVDRPGQIVALAFWERAVVSTPERVFDVGPLDDCRSVALSPDGEWLATGSHGKNGLQV
jgi:WD40 repeat protein